MPCFPATVSPRYRRTERRYRLGTRQPDFALSNGIASVPLIITMGVGETVGGNGGTTSPIERADRSTAADCGDRGPTPAELRRRREQAAERARRYRERTREGTRQEESRGEHK